jgi:hypothetical protein
MALREQARTTVEKGQAETEETMNLMIGARSLGIAAHLAEQTVKVVKTAKAEDVQRVAAQDRRPKGPDRTRDEQSMEGRIFETPGKAAGHTRRGMSSRTLAATVGNHNGL